MQDFKLTAEQLTPEIYSQFKLAMATGKWPDGRVLEVQQREIIMEAIILYEHANLPVEQHTGAMPERCASKQAQTETQTDTQTLKIKPS